MRSNVRVDAPPKGSSSRLVQKSSRQLTLPAKSPKPAAGLRFEQGIGEKDSRFGGLDVNAAILELLQPSSLIPGHRDVLTAGLRAWVIRPRAKNFIASEMCVEAGRQVARLETHVRRRVGSAAVGILRNDPKYRGLYANVFDAMGGVASLMQAYRASGSRSFALEKAEREVRYLVELISVLHAHCISQAATLKVAKANRYLRNRHIQPTSRETKKSKTLGAEQIRNYWRSHHSSLSLLYAASLLGPPNDPLKKKRSPKASTLLDLVLQSNAPLSLSSTELQDWIGIAEYVRCNVLEPTDMLQPRSKKEKRKNLYHIFSRVPPKSAQPRIAWEQLSSGVHE